MKMLKSVRFALILVLAIVLLGGFGAIASADDPFLCPVVGDGNDPGVGGIFNADDANGDNGVTAINPPVGPSLRPGDNQTTGVDEGKNQAGDNADPCHAFNREGPGDSDPPGDGNSDWSPIWPGDYPFEECD